MTPSYFFVGTLNTLTEIERMVTRLHTTHYPEHGEYFDSTHRDLVESLSSLRESVDRCRVHASAASMSALRREGKQRQLPF